MDRRVRGVVELTRHPRTGSQLGENLLGFGDRALHSLGSFGEHDTTAEGAQHVPAFDRHGFRHGEDAAVAAGDGGVGDADAGVAARRLDDHHARLQRPALDGVVDHGRPDAVLHGVERIEAFVLDDDTRRQASR